MENNQGIKTNKMDNNTNLNNTKKVPVGLLVAVMIIGLIGFTVIAYMIATRGNVFFDDPVRNLFYDARSPGLTTLMELITYAGQWPTIVVICLLLLIYPKTRSAYGIPATMAAILTQLLEKTIKNIVCRPRPDISLHLVEQGGYSFPSGHSITSMAVYLLLFILIMAYMKSGGKKTALLIITLFLSFGVGISRIYVGVHFPSDVLAGWFGGLMMIAVVLLIRDNTKIGRKYMMP
jgi:undecaprenyl-diphosphatase